MAGGLRQKIFTPKGFLGIFVIGVLMLFVYIQFADELENFWPDKAKMEETKKELKKRQNQLQELLNEEHVLDQDVASFAKYAEDFWYVNRDGNVETMVHKIIEDASQSVGLELTSIGRVQSKTIDKGVDVKEIQIQAKAPMGQVGAFIQKVYKLKPRFYWNRLSLRPDNQRTPKNVILAGTLRFYSVTDEGIIKLVLKK